MKRFIALVLAAGMAICCLGGCSGTPADTSGSGNPATDSVGVVGENPPSDGDKTGGSPAGPVYGGVLTFTPGVQNEQNLGDPSGDTNMMTTQNGSPALESLFRLDSNGEIACWLAESYDESENGLEYIFHIRQGVQFHDGTPLDAEAVVWNLQQGIEKGKPAYSLVDSAEAADEYTVRVKMKQPDILFLANLAADPTGLMISPAAWEKNGPEWAAKNPCGTGPFVFQEWQSDVKVVYTRNENYWGVDENGNQLPYLDGIVVSYMSETSVTEAALEAGEVQAWVRAVTDSLPKFGAMDNFIAAKAAVPVCNYQLQPCLGTDNPAAKKEVREAIAYAVDFDTIVEGLFSINSVRTTQCSVPGRIYYNEALTVREYNPEKAKELLAQAGYSGGVEINFYSENATLQEQMLTAMAPYLEAVGIKANIVLLDAGGFFGLLTGGFEDGFMLSGYAYAPHEFGKMYSLMSNSAALKVPNFSLDDATYELYEKARSSVTLDECVEYVHQIQENVYGEPCYIISYMTNYESVIQAANLKGAGFFEWAGYHWTPETAYFAQ